MDYYKELAQKAVNEWFGYQEPFELEMALRAIVLLRPEVVLEIGVAYGASLACWSEVTKPELSIGIDPLTIPKSEEQQKCFDNLVKTYNIQIIPHAACLPETHQKLKDLLKGKKVDFLFIDGNHRYDDVRPDFYSYLPYMNSPSIVGFHDIYYSDQLFDSGSQVSFLWNRLKLKYPYDEFHFHSTMGIGLLYLP